MFYFVTVLTDSNFKIKSWKLLITAGLFLWHMIWPQREVMGKANLSFKERIYIIKILAYISLSLKMPLGNSHQIKISFLNTCLALYSVSVMSFTNFQSKNLQWISQYFEYFISGSLFYVKNIIDYSVKIIFNIQTFLYKTV